MMQDDFEKAFMEEIYGESTHYPKIKNPAEINLDYIKNRISNIEKDIVLFNDWSQFQEWFKNNHFEYTENNFSIIQSKARKDICEFAFEVYKRLVSFSDIAIDLNLINSFCLDEELKYRSFDFLSLDECEMDFDSFQNNLVNIALAFSKNYEPLLIEIVNSLNDKGLITGSEIERWNKKQRDKWMSWVCPQCNKEFLFRYEQTYINEQVDKYGNSKRKLCVNCPNCGKTVVIDILNGAG